MRTLSPLPRTCLDSLPRNPTQQEPRVIERPWLKALAAIVCVQRYIAMSIDIPSGIIIKFKTAELMPADHTLTSWIAIAVPK